MEWQWAPEGSYRKERFGPTLGQTDAEAEVELRNMFVAIDATLAEAPPWPKYIDAMQAGAIKIGEELRFSMLPIPDSSRHSEEWR